MQWEERISSRSAPLLAPVTFSSGLIRLISTHHTHLDTVSGQKKDTIQKEVCARASAPWQSSFGDD